MPDAGRLDLALRNVRTCWRRYTHILAHDSTCPSPNTLPQVSLLSNRSTPSTSYTGGCYRMARNTPSADDTTIGIEEGEAIIARLVEPRPAGLSHLSQILSRGEINEVTLQVRGDYLNLEAQGPGKGGRQTVIKLKVAVSQESLLRMAPTLPFAPPTYHGDLRMIWMDTYNREHRQPPSVAHAPRIW